MLEVVLLGCMCIFAAVVTLLVVSNLPTKHTTPVSSPGGGGDDSGDDGGGELPALPEWATKDTSPDRAPQYAANKKLVQGAGNTQYDVVLYGDSITAALAAKFTKEWDTFAGGWKAAPLGVGGNTVQELTWRMMVGGEKFKKDPRVVIVLIGVNNLDYIDRAGSPVDKLDFLLGWMRKAMPTSKIIVLNVLPTSRNTLVGSTNAKYKSLAAKHGAEFSTCGSDLDPASTAQFSDGLHPASAGYTKLFKCLKPVVSGLL